MQKWVAEGLIDWAVQESCGFGFVLHHQLVAAGAQSFLITPIALARQLAVDLWRWRTGRCAPRHQHSMKGNT